MILDKKYDRYLNSCPRCQGKHVIRWGYYSRRGRPDLSFVKIQRIRCNDCLLSTNALPSFLLAHKSYHVHALETLLSLYIDQHHCWNQSPDFPMDLSTADRLEAKKRTYLVALLDDFSRPSPHAEFYWYERLPHLENTLHKAIVHTV